MAKRAGAELFVSSCESKPVLCCPSFHFFASIIRAHPSGVLILSMAALAGLSNYITTQRLENLFAPFGVIQQARLVVDPRTKKPKGFGFVRFQSESDAQKAMKALDGRIVDGRLIFVEVAETTRPGEDQS
ncbi:unnamed protein product [Linum tenue]|uniref:RRM domain-containing protein n=1 Tax=Linum tenue TaxID=586396 RepID=A0AAV0PWK4_9ROSI|nr:unnamed protein product [Linum tenue]